VLPLENNRAHVRLHDPQRAVTPGQAAVIYDGDVVVGGGWICRTTRHECKGRNALSSTR
jgi:tRNA-specific 2-thiouridylase